MFYKNGYGLFGFALFGMMILVSGCSETDIPQTLEPPFITTKVGITNTTVPRPSTTLSVGTTTNFNVGVAYSLTPEDDLNKANLALSINFFGTDANNNIIGIGPFPERRLPLTTNNLILTESISITIPLNARQVILEAYVETPGRIIAYDSRIWSAQ